MSPEWCRKIALAATGRRRPDIAVWAPDLFRQFTPEQAAQIRADRASGLTYRALAERHGCLVSTAFRVVNAIGPAYQA